MPGMIDVLTGGDEMRVKDPLRDAAAARCKGARK
jgi:hypothetical protein